MTPTHNQIRLVELDYLAGPRQLALTEAIMNAVAGGEAPPTLRLYSWSEPVVIIGVGQPVSDLNLEVCRERGYRVLRRIAGGTAVHHDRDEVSIDLILPAGHPMAPSDVHEGYRGFSGLLNQALESLGIDSVAVGVDEARGMPADELMRPICFASISPYEFFAGGRKLNGLCQIRRRDVISYQCAIYNRFRAEPLIAALEHDSAQTRKRRAERLDDFVTDMETLRGKPVDYARLENAIAAALEDQHGVSVYRSQPTEWEQAETERLISEKYGSAEWTNRR